MAVLILLGLAPLAGAQGLIPLAVTPPGAEIPADRVVDVGGNVLFELDDGVNGELLRQTDLTPAGTTLFGNLTSGRGTVADGLLIFTPADASLGRELWRCDGTLAGTFLLKDILPGAAGSEPGLWGPFSPGGLPTFFDADDGVHGRELWVSDGTAAGTHLAADVVPGPDGSLPYLQYKTPNGVALLQLLTSPSPPFLYAADASSATPAFLVEDTVAGLAPYSTTEYFEASDGRVYFSGETASTGDQLWVTNGTLAGTHFLGNVDPGARVSRPRGFFEIGGRLLFGASAPGVARELFSTDGTPGGITLVKDIVPGSDASNPAFLAHVNGLALFLAETPGEGREPWVTDGTEAGTVLLKDIMPGPESSRAYSFVPLGNEVIFVADDPTNVRQLWKTDGTSAGTQMVVDMAPWYVELGFSPLMVVVGDTVYFQAEGPRAGQGGIWRTDGTAAGTRPVVATQHPTFTLEMLGVAGGTLILRSRALKDGWGVWALDASVPACPPAPAAGCVGVSRASVLVKETKPERELLKLVLKGFDTAIAQSDLGDPVGGTTRYDVCLYDENDALAGTLIVNRAQGKCWAGTVFRECWKPRGTVGWRYTDKHLGSYGVAKMTLTGGAAGHGSVKLLAKNHPGVQVALPTGITAALAGDTSATVQFHTSAAACFTASLGTVSRATATQFKAKAP
jgi:ELWxxDGT repeat protein